jgi:hypothetical protein
VASDRVKPTYVEKPIENRGVPIGTHKSLLSCCRNMVLNSFITVVLYLIFVKNYLMVILKRLIFPK